MSAGQLYVIPGVAALPAVVAEAGVDDGTTLTLITKTNPPAQVSFTKAALAENLVTATPIRGPVGTIVQLVGVDAANTILAEGPYAVSLTTATSTYHVIGRKGGAVDWVAIDDTFCTVGNQTQ